MRVNVKSKALASAVLLLTSLGITTSCIDSSYDLDKDIDMTINVGGQYLSFPVGSTELVRLDKIIEVKEGDDLTLVDGAYHLIRKDNIDKTSMTVEAVMIENVGFDIDPIQIDINELPSIGNVPGILPGSYVIKDIAGNANIDKRITGIDKAVIEIKTLTAVQAPEVNLTIKLKLEGNLNYSEATLKDLKIVFPKFLQFKAGTPGLIGNTYTIKSKDVPKGSTYTITLPVTGFSFGTKEDEGKTRELDGSFLLQDKVEISTDIELDGLSSTTNPSLKFAPTITLDAMEINSMKGIVKPEIKIDPTDVTLSNLPDFLQDEDVVLDITNPIISFMANNPLNANIELSGAMTGYKNGKITKTVKIGRENGKTPIILEPSGSRQQTIALTRKAITIEGATDNIVVEDLNDLIETIPDRITVELKPSIEPSRFFEIGLGRGQAYELNSSYKIDIPLSFGTEMKIVYKESIDGFRSDLKDIEFTKVAIALTVDNAIPLQLEITEDNITPKDVSGKRVDGVKVTVTGAIAESRDGETPVTSNLSIAIEETTPGAMNKVDGIDLKVTAKPGQALDVQLKSTQWLQLKDIKLRVPNGVKVDLDKL